VGEAYLSRRQEDVRRLLRHRGPALGRDLQARARPALLQDRRFYVPAYFEPGGWLALDFGARKRVDWGEVAELMESSYRQVALKRMLKALEERG
jgi:hypothetical protein